MLVDGTGAPPVGPVDIVIEGNRIREVHSVGFPKVPIRAEGRPKDATKEIDGTHLWVLPAPRTDRSIVSRQFATLDSIAVRPD